MKLSKKQSELFEAMQNGATLTEIETERSSVYVLNGNEGRIGNTIYSLISKGLIKRTRNYEEKFYNKRGAGTLMVTFELA